MIIYAGDIHGCPIAASKIDHEAAKAGVTHIIQVGDFGLAFHGNKCPLLKYFKKRSRQGKLTIPWITVGGNHDNYDWWNVKAAAQGNPDMTELAPGVHWAARGFMTTLDGTSHLFCGGAESTDKLYRTEGKSWWADETPTYEEFSRFADALDEGKPQVVVTHDVPLRVDMFRVGRDQNATPRNLENALKVSSHAPKKWYYGHHHVMDSCTIDGTTFMGCGIGGEYVKSND